MIHGNCPFFSLTAGRCSLSARRPLDVQRRRHCASEDHDSCPSYLAYLLRRSRPLRSDNDWHDAQRLLL